MVEQRDISSLSSVASITEARKFTVRAEYFEGQIDPKRFHGDFPEYRVVESDPLIIEPAPGEYAVLTKFGGVVFWGCSDATMAQVLQKVRSLPGTLNLNEKVRDTLHVYVGKDRDDVTFSEVWLRELTPDRLKIISLALAQSVALDRFEAEVLEVLQTFAPVLSQLRKDGRLRMSTQAVVKAVGFAMDVRGATLANLTLFDSPPETWESEALAHLDSDLYDHFDLEERLSAINQKLDFLSDVNATLMDVLNSRKAQRLEWIVIVLIAVEIVLFVVMEMVRK